MLHFYSQSLEFAKLEFLTRTNLCCGHKNCDFEQLCQNRVKYVSYVKVKFQKNLNNNLLKTGGLKGKDSTQNQSQYNKL